MELARSGSSGVSLDFPALPQLGVRRMLAGSADVNVQS